MNEVSRLRLRHLQVFVEVAHQESVSEAARLLNLTQPAVTRTLRDLEDICRHALVERAGRGIRLTAYGRVFLEHAGRSLTAARTGMTALEDVGEASGPVVRIGALPTVATTVMPSAISRYRESGMRARLRVVSGENHVLLDQLRAGDLDLVMGRLSAPETMQGLVFEPLYHDRVVFVVAADHPILAAGRGWPAELARYPVLIPSPHSIIRPFVDRLFVELGIAEPADAIETVAHSFGHTFTAYHRAIWIISRGVVATELRAGTMRTLPVDTRSTQGSVGLNRRADDDLSAAARAFADVLRVTAADPSHQGAEPC